MPRRAESRTPPSTARGARTRAALVAAARVVFERDGYLDARLLDITTQAQCAAGTFYTYFDTKEDILEAVLEQVREDMLHPGFPHVADADDAAAVVAASNLAYLEAYRRNAALMAVLEQVSATSERFRRLRNERAETFINRNARAIERLQAQGRVDPELDAVLASRALSGMLSRTAYGYFVQEGGHDATSSVSYEALVRTVNRLWCNALGLTGR